MPPAQDNTMQSPESFVALSTSATPTKSAHGKRFRWVAGIAAACGIVGLTVGLVALTKTDNSYHSVSTALQQTTALKINLVIKQTTMVPVGGANTATIYAIPSATSTDGHLQFDATVAFPDPVDADRTIEYTIVANKAYMATRVGDDLTSVQCVDPAQVPSFSLIQTSLAQATVVDSVQIADAAVQGGACDGTWLQAKFMGERYVACKSFADQITSIEGQDVSLTIEYVDDSSAFPAIQVPTAVDGSRAMCADLPVAPIESKSLTQRATEAMDVMSLTPRTASIFSPSCGCKLPKKKPCLFVHGLGNLFAGEMTNSFPFYWGWIHDNAPCCSSIKFVHFDTINQGWDDTKLQDQFCDAALQVSAGASGNTLGDLLLVTHSMGNTIASGAIASGRCQADASKLTWVSLAAPMQGSKTVNLMQYECTTGGWNSIIKDPATFLGVCPPARAFVSMQHMSTVNQDMHAKFTAAQNVRTKYVTHAACGNNDWGLNTIYSLPLFTVGEWAKHDSANDGLVDWNSCTAGLNPSAFGGSTTSKFYAGPLNHADLTFRNIDGLFGDNRKPTKWFKCAV
ncbi:Aste57867_10324 [Aphanomyces stellatus]|uniref:Aste57867_10324 protein n=1 Tax=Aphanomyces stellatus TaxID=120398 RepID=A0A485KQQ8_9STRA|nr:hypothetical protein As57867_010284 [Aphanomyces stellatus]VFT87198.1 Aste57867_10324 [Aphanomyces stellatus]